MADVIELRRQEYDARQSAVALRREVFEGGKSDRMADLFGAEAQLADLSAQRAAAEKVPGANALALTSGPAHLQLLGPQTTKLDARIDLRLAQVPTALVHLFDATTRPLVACQVTNLDQQTRRICFTTYVEGYSAHAIDTVEIQQGQEVSVPQLPTFFPERLRSVTELTRATVNVEIRDLDAKTELTKTLPVWLLAQTTAPLQVLDPASGTLHDLTPYLGAFVTPNQPDVIRFARTITDFHPDHRLIGYQISKNEVEPQIRAVFEALKKHGIRYVNSIIDFTPENGSQNQRVRRPRETLTDQAGNCIDLTLLFCSLLESISINPALVLIPGHAFVAWETWRNLDEWRYLEATMIPTASFEEAWARGDSTAAFWAKKSAEETKLEMFRRWSLRELRARGITPLE